MPKGGKGAAPLPPTSRPVFALALFAASFFGGVPAEEILQNNRGTREKTRAKRLLSHFLRIGFGEAEVATAKAVRQDRSCVREALDHWDAARDRDEVLDEALERAEIALRELLDVAEIMRDRMPAAGETLKLDLPPLGVIQQFKPTKATGCKPRPSAPLPYGTAEGAYSGEPVRVGWRSALL